MGQLQGQFLIAIDRQNFFSLATIAALIANFILAIILVAIFHLGANGAAVATVFSELVATSIEAYYLKDVSGLESYFRFFIRYSLLGIPIVASVIIIRSIVSNHLTILVGSILLGSLAYFGALLITKDELFFEIIHPLISKFRNR